MDRIRTSVENVFLNEMILEDTEFIILGEQNDLALDDMIDAELEENQNKLFDSDDIDLYDEEECNDGGAC